MNAGINLPPPFVDRKKEIAMVCQFIDRVSSGSGGILLFEGESGVGKTRLMDEARKKAEEKGFFTLCARCLPGTVSPLMLFHALLKAGNMEHLLAESFPRLDALYLVNKGGIILSKYEKSVKNIDPDIFLGMVTAVENFIRDSMSQIAGKNPEELEEKLGVMRHGEFTIVNMPGKTLNLVALVEGVENEYLIGDLNKLIERIETKRSIDGNLAEIEDLLRELVESEKYSMEAPENVDKKIGVFENVLRGIKRAAMRVPVLIFIDDLQWADSSSLSLLHYIGRDISTDKVGIICAARTGEGPGAGAFEAIIKEMRAENIAEVHTLRPLDREGVGELIDSVLAGHVEEKFKDTVYIETEGNPLFVVELLRYLTEKGLLRRELDVWVYEKEEIKVPERIYEIIKEKISRLSAEEFEVIETASVIGAEFPTQFLERLMDLDRIKLLRALSRIEKIHGLIKQEGGKYRFDPSKIRDVIYEEMGEDLRRALHEMLGKIFEEDYRKGDEEKILEAIYHYRKAGRGDKLKEYGFLVADKLASRFGYEEALGLLRELYATLNMGDLNEREKGLLALQKMAEILLKTGLYEEAMKVLDEKVTLLGENAAERGRTFATKAE
ncbi:MAG: AAA family ATPase, partial [Thermoplasmata archaeon]